jgi:hypothetical protein
MMSLHCCNCGIEFGNGNWDFHNEYVQTHDPVWKAWEYWYCCHKCRDAGEPCETFFKPEVVESPQAATPTL